MLAEPAASASAKYVAEIDIAFPLRRRSELGAVLPVGAKLIVFGSLFGISEHFISFLDFLELLFRLFAVGVQVGMVFPGEFAMSLLDFLILGIAGHAQRFVIVA